MATYQPDRAQVVKTMVKCGIAVVMGGDHIRTAEQMVVTVEEVYRAGYIPEVTFRIDAGVLDEAMTELRAMRGAEFAEGRRMVLGVGSIIDTNELDKAVALGFDLLVGPGNIVSGGVDPASVLKPIQGRGIAVA
ncbi:MAG: hypothetical protein O3A46_08265, partial [Candidatus Poribacteria bacterium]|nr:hypothetical protein [Candidatus Poribacteria bacterium]